MKEVWKWIPGYRRAYEVSNKGRVKSYKTGKGRILSSNINRGYLRICLSNNSILKYFSVHRLVLLVFRGPSELECNHIDGNKANNHLGNLEYYTRSDNLLHAYRTGLRLGQKGEKHGAAKLNYKQVEEIRERLNRGESQSNIAKDYSVSRPNINLINKNKAWKR